MVVVLSTEIKHSILQLCWLCLWKIVWTTASGEPCRRCAICCCRKSAPGALLFPSLLGSRMSVVSVNINTVFWVMRHVSVFSREMAALHLDFVVSSLLWDRGSMILKFGNRVDSSSSCFMKARGTRLSVVSSQSESDLTTLNLELAGNPATLWLFCFKFSHYNDTLDRRGEVW